MRLLRSALCIAALLLPAPALAVEGGTSPYPKGFGGFLSGVTPAPGTYASYIFYYFHGSADASTRNGIAEFNVGAHADLNLLEGTWITDATILGGRYGVSGAFDYLDTGLEGTFSLPGGAQQAKLHTGGMSDSLLSPIILGWDSGNWHWNTDLLIYVPTGSLSHDPVSQCRQEYLGLHAPGRRDLVRSPERLGCVRPAHLCQHDPQ